MKRLAAKRGFTLLEVLIASIIASFIALVAVGALRAVTAGRTLVYRNIAAADELRYAIELLRSDLENVYRDSAAEGQRFVGSFAEMDRDMVTSLRMRIISRVGVRPQQPEGDVCEVEYYLAGSEEAPALMRRVCPIVGNENDELTQGGMLTPIAQNIVGFEVRYFDGAEWLFEWPLERNAFPEMVEITVTAVEIDESGRRSPAVRSLMATFPRMPGSSEAAARQATEAAE
ncbi:MAG: prepilin-type N-terminal cleavage/methylation domain-containing protein [Phycisphaerae bacterium]|nr:prepilin-type N-terminal cleavage/methylation domain-containing protein [Phycisphaerae bacterium]